MMPIQAYGESPGKLIKEGNRSYASGNYDDALSSYDEASVEAPEMPRIYFNRGTVFYQKQDYAGAAAAFEQAALKTRDIRLEARSKFNLGVCSFREAERQMDSDLNKALEACRKSVQYFQETLTLDPGFNDAAENIEIVRLKIKDILDKMKNQQEEKQDQQGDENNKEKQDQQTGGGTETQNQSSSDGDQQQNSGDPDKEETVTVQMPDDPQNILDGEKENKKRRQLKQSGGYQKVDRDW